MSTNESQVSAEQVLRERAERLAQAGSDDLDRKLALDAAVIAVGDERFGVPASGIREIVHVPPLSTLPGLPAWLPGIAQIRGELISVLDLAKFLGIDGAEDRGGCLVVVEGREGPLGLLGDEVLGFRGIYADELSEGFAGAASTSARPIKAMTTDLVSVLDLEKLMANDTLIINQTAAY